MLLAESELADDRMSAAIAAYRVDASNQRSPTELVMASYGLQVNRLAAAPPTEYVDVESRLMNRYDMIGKAGFVYRGSGDDAGDHAIVMPSPPLASPMASPEDASSFLQSAAARDYRSGPCITPSVTWRDDIVTVRAPEYAERAPYVDTRMMSKEHAAAGLG